MAQAAPVNTDVPSSWMIPGTYLKLDLSGSGAALNNIARRVLLVGYKSSAGSAAQDTPIQAVGQSQANAFAGQGSDLARLFAAWQSQVGGGSADVFLLPIVAPSSGTAATQLIIFSFSTGSSAAAQDSIDLWICGYKISVLVASGDTTITLLANVVAAINLNLDIPVVASGNGSDTLTLTYRHKGLVGNDMPMICNLNNSAASNLRASPGTVTYATTAVGSGSATVTNGGTTYTTAITNGDLNTDISSHVGATINGTAGPFTASVNAGVVTLYFVNDRVVRRTSAAIITTTGTTAVVGSAGTLGAGTPTLTTALAVCAAQGAFPYWATCFNEVTSLGTISAHIEANANGLYQKGQTLWAASCDTLAIAGAVPVGTSPALTASTRYHFGWSVDSPQQAYELAARHCAMVTVQDFKAYNYDGTPLVSQTATVPLLLTHRNSRPSPDAINSALRSYYLTPYAVDDGTNQMVVVRSRTTSSDSDERKWDTSLIQTADYVRYDMGIFLRGRFKNKSIKAVGKPRTVNTITVDDVADAIIERILTYEGADLYDGADQLKTAVKANINVLSPTRIDAGIPFRPPVPLHVLAPVVGLV